MGRLIDDTTGQDYPVPGRMLVGRSPSCFLRLDVNQVSGEHALLQWTGSGWNIRDLGSRNGTYLNGRRLEVGAADPLRAGAKIAFGDPNVTWTFRADTPPVPIAIELKERTIVEPQHGLLGVPSDADPAVVVYQDQDGRWVKEVKGEQSNADDQDVIYLENQVWCLFLPSEVDVTPLVHAQVTLPAVTFRFSVSRDEEHVELALSHGAQEIRLEPREHHYVLLTLARARARDRELPVAERGWLDKDELQRMLRMRPNALNVAIHRARQQLADAGLMGAAGIVEVRRGMRRFGTDKIEERPL